MTILHYLIHTVAYYFSWFACLGLAARGYAWISSIVVLIFVAIQLHWEHRTRNNLREFWSLLVIVVFFSTLIDSAFVFMGVADYAANPFAPYFTPPWMVTIWISFSVTLYATLSSFFDKLILLGVLSFFGFAFAFRLGSGLGAVFFPYGSDITCFFIGLIWAVMLPFCIHCYKTVNEHK